MEAPDRFYYNLGDWFRDVERELQELEEASHSSPNVVEPYDFGLAAGNFFRGIMDSTQDYGLSERLTNTFITNTPTTDDDGPGIIFTPEDDGEF